MKKRITEYCSSLLNFAHNGKLERTHVPSLLNSVAGLVSRGNPLYGEWTLSSKVLHLEWERFWQAVVDFFTFCKNVQWNKDALLVAHPWPNMLQHMFPPLSLIAPVLLSEGAASILNSDSAG